MNKVGLIIPCYNVERSIKKIVKIIVNLNFLNRISKIVFIDNNSHDNTVKIIQKYKIRNKKIILIKNKFNFGYGGSIKVATNYLIDQSCSHAIIVHSDDQINISNVINDFFNRFDQTKSEFILSSRFYNNNLYLTKDYKTQRRFANLILTFFFKNLINYKFSDIGSGIIFFSLKLMKKLKFKELSNEMHFHIHLNILASELAVNPQETALAWHDSKIKSNTNDYKIGTQIIYILFFYFFKNKILKRNIFNSLPFKKKYNFFKKYLIER
jgi:glycosyltransferase involved in cell wall biosynthesis